MKQKKKSVTAVWAWSPTSASFPAHGLGRRPFDQEMKANVPNFWVEETIADDWIAAYRLGVSGGTVVVAELRIFPRDPGSPIRLPGEWSGCFRGVTAKVPPGGLKARTVKLPRVGDHLANARALVDLSTVTKYLETGLLSPVKRSRARKASAQQKRPVGPGAPPLSNRHYEQLARECVRLCQEGHGRDYADVIAKARGVKPTTIRSQIRRARKIDYLAKTHQGQRGAQLGAALRP